MASFKQIKAKNKQGYKWICTKDGPLDSDGKRTQVKRRGDTQKEAEKKVDDVIKDLEKGIKKAAEVPRFDRAAAEWLEVYARGNVKEPTVELRKFHINVLKEYYKNQFINKITLDTHQKAVNKMFDDGYSHSSILNHHSAANMIFKFAIKQKYIKENPVTGVTIPVKKTTIEDLEGNPIAEKYFERDELERFLKASIEHGLDQDKEIFHLFAFTGMRIGELIALKETDLTRKTNRIRISKTKHVRSRKNEYKLGTPKNKGSFREFEVDPVIMDMLVNLKKRRLGKKPTPGEPQNPDAHFVFQRNNLPFRHGLIEDRFERLLKIAGIKKHATPHTLRHTHISMLTEAEVSLQVIMKRVGHDDPKTTLKIYTHVTEKMQQNMTEKVHHAYADLLNRATLQDL